MLFHAHTVIMQCAYDYLSCYMLVHAVIITMKCAYDHLSWYAIWRCYIMQCNVLMMIIVVGMRHAISRCYHDHVLMIILVGMLFGVVMSCNALMNT